MEMELCCPEPGSDVWVLLLNKGAFSGTVGASLTDLFCICDAVTVPSALVFASSCCYLCLEK